MGKASKWLKGLLGFKKPDPAHAPHSKSRWSFAKSHRRSQDAAPDDETSTRRAIAVAAASAAVAEAAVKAAQAAAAVVELTTGSGGGGFNSVAYVTENGAGYGRREERAAVMIQSHFRAYLSRRALRALKALVMLQALVRGQILRKHYFERLRRMRVIARAQRAPSNSSPIYHYGQAMQESFDYTILARNAMQDQLVMLMRKGSRSNSCNVAHDRYSSPLIRHKFISTDDESNDKILEVDTWKPTRNHLFRSPQHSNHYLQTFSVSGEVGQLSHTKFNPHDDDNDFATAENSPQYYSASSMGGGSSSSSIRTPFSTPTKSDGPSYMAYTESSKAKVRSLSAPKQRPPYERSSSTNRYSVHGYGDSRPNKASALHANFTSKVYSGSGHLDRLGMPVVSGFSGGHWHRY